MRVAVTGGCGFIGSHVVDHLVKADHDVVVIDCRERWLNPGAEYLIADLFDPVALDSALDGPRMRDALVVARFVSAAKEGKPITIAGTGDQQRNFVYVEDLAQAHVLALSPAAANQTFALEGGTPVAEIAETVQHLVRQVPVVHTPGKRADYDGVSISNRLAKELLNWSPSTPLGEGLRRYLTWLETRDRRL